MKFLLAKTPEIIQKSLEENKMQALYVDFHYHPVEIGRKVDKFIEEESKRDNGIYITYNTLALNHIPADMILWLEEIPNEDWELFESRIVIKPFWEVFKTWKPLSTGDVFEFICHNLNYDEAKEFLPNKELLKEGKIQYFISDFYFQKMKNND